MVKQKRTKSKKNSRKQTVIPCALKAHGNVTTRNQAHPWEKHQNSQKKTGIILLKKQTPQQKGDKCKIMRNCKKVKYYKNYAQLQESETLQKLCAIAKKRNTTKIMRDCKKVQHYKNYA